MKRTIILLAILLLGQIGFVDAKTPVPAKAKKNEIAIFAGGNFWCMEPPFRGKKGVVEVLVGYTGGTTENPTYEEVMTGTTGHAEAVQITFDPDRISYSELLDIYWRNVNPTQADGQFVDQGTQYRTEIFFTTPDQKKLAEESKLALSASGRFETPIVTRITAATKFTPAEESHQNFSSKDPQQYKSYRDGSGRDKFIEKTWGPTAH